MTKNIIIVILAVFLVLSTAYGVVQETEADKLRVLAASAEQRALAAQAEAEMQSKLADANAVEANRQKNLALEAMKRGGRK